MGLAMKNHGDVAAFGKQTSDPCHAPNKNLRQLGAMWLMTYVYIYIYMLNVWHIYIYIYEYVYSYNVSSLHVYSIYIQLYVITTVTVKITYCSYHDLSWIIEQSNQMFLNIL